LIIETVQRAYRNVVANWPLILISVAEQVAMVGLIVVGALLAVVPFIMTGALSELSELSGNPARMAIGFFLQNPLTIIGVIVALTIVLTAVTALHSFVRAGTVGIYIDSALTAPAGSSVRDALSLFSTETFISYGKRFWWPVFLIFNVIWGIFSIILLAPLAAAVLLFTRLSEDPQAVAWGCLLLVLFFLILLVVGIAATMWTDVAVALTVRRNLGVRDSLQTAFNLMMRRFMDLLMVIGVLIVISIGVWIVFATIFGVIGVVSMLPIMAILTLPIQIVLSLLQSIASVFLSCWFLAAVVAIVIDDEGARSIVRA